MNNANEKMARFNAAHSLSKGRSDVFLLLAETADTEIDARLGHGFSTMEALGEAQIFGNDITALYKGPCRGDRLNLVMLMCATGFGMVTRDDLMDAITGKITFDINDLKERVQQCLPHPAPGQGS